jgi:hypothetical protein
MAASERAEEGRALIGLGFLAFTSKQILYEPPIVVND